MASAARMKSKPKQNTKNTPLLRTGIRVLVEDLRVGDRIVTSWHTRSEAANTDGVALTVDEVMDVLRDGETNRFVNRSVEVRSFSECSGAWRTHVHINKQECYDMRTYVWIVKQ